MRRLIRATLVATALAGLVMLFAQLAPESPPPPDKAAERPSPLPAPAESLPGSTPESVARASRDVTPPGVTRPQQAEGGLVRLPPRPPLADPEAAPDAQARETRLRLLHRPVAVDAGTLSIEDATIRLMGVDALPLASQCGSGTSQWPCGMRSRTALRSWLRARSVRCEAPEGFGERAETIESRCTLGGEDVGDWVVRNGWAKAAPGGPYAEAERQARDNRRGIWRDGDSR